MASTFEKVSGSNSYVHDDIVFSILSKLSIKSLKRFSCVRKSWSHLFENAYFMNMFRNNVLSKSHSPYDDDDDDDDACYIFKQLKGPVAWLFRTGDKFEKEIKLDPPPPFCIHQNDACICILSSAVDGILCIYEWISDTMVVLWNPATNEVYAVPPYLPECLPNVRVHFLLHGFGYDHVSDDYKVIRFVLCTTSIIDSQEHVHVHY
ncbi:F-box/kelch-repeat protein [Trifolium repens]|nr:F-box/kelch-repeat protein [Trifolium repens]